MLDNKLILNYIKIKKKESMKYHIEKKGSGYTLQHIAEGRKIENLSPYEAYQILYSDDLANKITEFMDRVNKIQDGTMMFGKDVRELFTEAFRTVLAPAADRIEELESLHDVDSDNNPGVAVPVSDNSITGND